MAIFGQVNLYIHHMRCTYMFAFTTGAGDISLMSKVAIEIIIR